MGLIIRDVILILRMNFVHLLMPKSGTEGLIKSQTKCLDMRPPSTGVGNSFYFAGHIRDKLGIRGPVYVLMGKKLELKREKAI
jgi:hypothetical protein